METKLKYGTVFEDGASKSEGFKSLALKGSEICLGCKGGLYRPLRVRNGKRHRFRQRRVEW